MTLARAALAYATRLGRPVAPAHSPVEIDGRIVCSCIHKPDPRNPTRCACGHVRLPPGGPCSCGRHDCRVRCSGPCARIGKHPRTPHGRSDATTDVDQIRAWWRRSPTANILVPTGADSGLVVLDLDRHLEQEDGVEAFDGLCRELGIELPETPIALTGGNGVQYFFKHPGADYYITSRCGSSALRPGVELKGDGGYVIVSPSLHRSGRRYCWDAGAHPLDVPVADCPPALLELLVGQRRRRDASPATGPAAASFLARAWRAAGWTVGADLDTGAVAVCCPWHRDHTDGRGDGSDSSTVVLPPTERRPLGTFVCSHGHCVGRGTVAVLRALPDVALASLADTDPAGFALALHLLHSRTAA